MSPSTDQLPRRLKGREEGTWAESTIVNRFPDILRRTLRENQFSPTVERPLVELLTEIPDAPIRHLRDRHAPDAENWRAYIAPVRGWNWLEASWFFVEHYFYRRIMEAVDYFGGGPDPFQWQKDRGLATSRQSIRSLSQKINGWIKGEISIEIVEEMLEINLWGNQADLSLWPADQGGSPDPKGPKVADQHLLVDEGLRALKRWQGWVGNGVVVDFLIDNAGFELVSDLAFSDLLLSGGWASKVRFHLKAHPTFVSDAVIRDVRHTVHTLAEAEDSAVQSIGARLTGHLQGGRLTLKEDFFWNSPLDFWDLPSALEGDLSQADLLISKGDANYRRLVGDRHWSFQTPFAEVVDYLPLPLLALRTLKAEVLVGVSRPKIETAREEDPDWMVDGQWGVIQYAPEGDRRH